MDRLKLFWSHRRTRHKVYVVNRLWSYPPPPLPRRHSLWTAPYINTKLLLGFWLNFQYEGFIFFDRLCAMSSEMLPLFSSTQHCTRLWPSARHQARDEDEQGEKSHFRVPSVNSLFTPKDKRFPLPRNEPQTHCHICQKISLLEYLHSSQKIFMGKLPTPDQHLP